MAHREADLAGGSHQRIALVEVLPPPGEEVVGGHEDQADGHHQIAVVDQDGVVSRQCPGHDQAGGDHQVEDPGDPAAAVVREGVRPDVPRDIEVFWELIP